MRISDWSSDVCSSDLQSRTPLATPAGFSRADHPASNWKSLIQRSICFDLFNAQIQIFKSTLKEENPMSQAVLMPAIGSMVNAICYDSECGTVLKMGDRKSTRLNSSH